MKINFTEKVLSPFFSGYFVLAAMAVYFIICCVLSLKFGYFDIEETGATEVITYLFYGFALGVACCFSKDFLDTNKQNTFFALIFLWAVAFLRETGIQHWLTTHDTVITKTRFFLNPNNPLYEKIIAGLLFLLVFAVFGWVLCKYVKKLIYGFCKFQAIPWTFATFLILAVITQIADRYPANYLKGAGVELANNVAFILKILEEGGESLLPLLFAIGLVQYHFLLSKNK